MEYLVMTTDELAIYNARQKLKKPMIAYIWRMRMRRLRCMMVIRIQRTWRMYYQREYSFIRGLQLERYPVIYFLREQRIRFTEVLSNTCKRMKHAYQPADVMKNFVQ